MNIKRFIILTLLYILFGVSTNIIHPITTDYVHSLNLPTFYFGIFYSLMSLGMALGAVIFGKLSDIIGRKILLSISFVGYGIFQMCFGFINTIPPLILVFRFFSGIFASAPTTLFVTLALDNLEEVNRTKYLSLFSSSITLGGALGYALGGALYSNLHLDFKTIFIIQFITCLVLCLLGSLLLKESKIIKEDKNNSTNKMQSFNFPHLVFLLGVLLIAMGQININKYFDVFIIDLGYTASNLGFYTLLTGIICFIFNLIIIPLLKKGTNANTNLLLLLCVLFSSVLSFITFNVNLEYLVITLFSSHLIYLILKIMITSLQQTYIAKTTKKENYGLMIGIMQSVLSLGNVIAPLIGSLVYEEKEVLLFNISSLFILIGFIIFLILFIFNKKRNNITNN